MSRDNDDDRLRARVRLCGADSLNELDRWRWQDLHRRERRAEAAERRRQSEQHNEVEQLRAELWNELANMRAELEQRVSAEAVGTFVGETFDKALDKAEQAARDMQRDLFTLVERRFAELGARLDVMSGTPAAKKAFRFANEPARDDKTEPVEIIPDFRKVMN
jgi:hypothetical protein